MEILRYQSKGKIISKSLCHPDMWIVNCPDGKFYAINTSTDAMLRMNPPNIKYKNK